VNDRLILAACQATLVCAFGGFLPAVLRRGGRRNWGDGWAWTVAGATGAWITVLLVFFGYRP
jgi:hypothetical protein